MSPALGMSPARPQLFCSDTEEGAKVPSLGQPQGHNASPQEITLLLWLLWLPSAFGQGMLSGYSTKSPTPSLSPSQHHEMGTAWTHPEKTHSKTSPCTPTAEGADAHPRLTPEELVLTGTALAPGPGRAPGPGDGGLGGGWQEVALEPGVPGGRGLPSKVDLLWGPPPAPSPLAAPCPPTCSLQGKGCLVRLRLGCAGARSDRWPLENQPSKSCPSFCEEAGGRG